MMDIWTDLDQSIPYLYTEHTNTPNFSGSLPVFYQQKIFRTYYQNQ